MDEVVFQEKVSDEFRSFCDDSPSGMKENRIVERFRNRLPDIMRRIGDEFGEIETASGRSVKPSEVEVEIRSFGGSKVLVQVCLHAETRTWMETL